MKNEHNIERLITLLSCSHCATNFDESCINLLEINYDTVMVKIVCKECGKKYILAFMDLNFSFFDATLGMPGAFEKSNKCEEKEETECEMPYVDIFDPGFYFEDMKHKPCEHLDKITYDDVLEAHDFIQNFEENWRRYMDKRKYNYYGS